MSARDCKYCERDDCDTDCSFTDSHFGTTRRSAAEWRAIGAESQHTRIRGLEAALGEALGIIDEMIPSTRCDHLSDYVGRGALTDNARCNMPMPCDRHPSHRIATLRRLLEGK